jgi:hypothetical protein
MSVEARAPGGVPFEQELDAEQEREAREREQQRGDERPTHVAAIVAQVPRRRPLPRHQLTRPG